MGFSTRSDMTKGVKSSPSTSWASSLTPLLTKTVIHQITKVLVLEADASRTSNEMLSAVKEMAGKGSSSPAPGS